MAQLKAEIKRGFLRSLYRADITTNGTNSNLFNALGAFQDSGFSAVKSGRLVINHTGAGKATTLATPDAWRSFSQEECFSLSEELIQVYTDVQATLISDGTNTPTDLQMLNTMLADDRLQSITRTERDYTLINYPNRY